MKPIIGVIEWPYLDKDEDVIYEVLKEVIDKVSKHGGIPAGIFPTQVEDYIHKKIPEIEVLKESEKNDLNDILSVCDGIIKPGATRIYPYEKYITDFALHKKIPYFGICAGMQTMAHFGKDKIENNRLIESDIQHSSKETYAHKIRITKSSVLYDILKEEEIIVNSRHRYKIASSGIFKEVAHAFDGTVEAIENSNHDFQMGFQWHPELLEDENSALIFERFIDASKKQKEIKIYIKK